MRGKIPLTARCILVVNPALFFIHRKLLVRRVWIFFHYFERQRRYGVKRTGIDVHLFALTVGEQQKRVFFIFRRFR